MKIACPQCEKKSNWSKKNPWRPFCSERCKMLDLGHWMLERYSIPDESEPAPGDTDDGEDHNS